MAAVTKYVSAIRHIQNPTEDVQLAAVKANADAIIYIKNPSEAAQLEAISKEIFNLNYIKEPSNAAIELANRLYKDAYEHGGKASEINDGHPNNKSAEEMIHYEHPNHGVYSTCQSVKNHAAHKDYKSDVWDTAIQKERTVGQKGHRSYYSRNVRLGCPIFGKSKREETKKFGTD